MYVHRDIDPETHMQNTHARTQTVTRTHTVSNECTGETSLRKSSGQRDGQTTYHRGVAGLWSDAVPTSEGEV